MTQPDKPRSWRHSIWRLRMAWLHYRLAAADRQVFLLNRALYLLSYEEPTQ
ncbi:hypothetical protein [Blastomonas sp. AAP25]|uniref:hypothetical protein n=1 Tax=Blastomonas sp. AAP25 TaxID=1523416 RepID=UPI000A48D09E|nr:hypothetical protein [Blastomonas sp. AAP25]